MEKKTLPGTLISLHHRPRARVSCRFRRVTSPSSLPQDDADTLLSPACFLRHPLRCSYRASTLTRTARLGPT